MVFGWFGKKSTKDQSLAKAKKLVGQGRAAEALTYYEDALEADAACDEAREGIAACRRSLVELNLEEARFCKDTDAARAVEHLELARNFAGNDKILAAEVDKAAREVKAPSPARRKEPEAPKRMFETSCGCASPSCGDSCGGEGEEADIEDLFAFYMDGVGDDDRRLFEAQGPAFREAFVALQQGEPVMAKNALARAKKEEKDSAALAYARGLLFSLEGNPAGAEKSFAEALAKDPEFPAAVHHRAVALRELKRPADAAKLVGEWLERRPSDEEARTLLAVSYFEAGRPADAKAAFAPLATEKMASEPGVAVLWGRINEASGDPAAAIAAYTAATARNPNLVDALFPLGVLLMQQGGRGPENAIKAFKQCYKADPERGGFYLLKLAEAYATAGWKKEAREMLARAREECPDVPEARAACDAVEAKLAG